MEGEAQRPAPAAGWYQAPEGPGLRYWDGAQWTEHYHEPPEAPTESVAMSQDGEPSEGEGIPSADHSQRVHLDAKDWLDEAAIICTNDFEPAAELILQIGTVKMLCPGYVPLQPAPPEWRALEGGDTQAACLGNCRLGYALRNWECQRIPSAQEEVADDGLAAKADEMAATPNLPAMWIPALIEGIITHERYGGPRHTIESTPGATAEARREVLRTWLEKFPSEDRYTGRWATERLVLFGYLLHRLYDIRPQLLED